MGGTAAFSLPMTTRIVSVLLAFLLAGPAFAAGRKPNIVLILADDLGYECISANGGQSYQTPNIDRLAATGVRFEQCHVQPLCTPTRVALMTGLANKRNYTHFGHLDPGQVTFANVLQKAGYATCIAGKWQLSNGFEGPGRFGFDEYCLWQLTRRPERYKNPGLEINGKLLDYTKGEYGPDLVSDYVLDFVTRKKGEPFLLYYPMMLVHSPFVPTPDSPDYNDPVKGKDAAQQHFAEMVGHMDKLVGKLVAKLEELGLRENTMILFVGDNGTGKGIVTRFQGRAYDGGKGDTNAHGTHVPLIGNWPGRFPSGRVCPDLVDASDFFPTLCELTGNPAPAGVKFDGRSFLPQLRGEKGDPREWRYTWYNPSGGPVAKAEFAHDRQFKLYADGRFFDVAADELEQHPLDSKAPDGAAGAAKAKLAAALEQFKGPRPEAIEKQSQPFGGEGGGDDKPKGKGKGRGKNRAKA